MAKTKLLILKDLDACRRVADELYPIAERNKFPWPLAGARFLRGWVAAQEGDRDRGIEQMAKATEEPSAAVLRPISLALIAEQEMPGGRFEDALGILDRAIRVVHDQPSRFYEPEIIRLCGEALLALSPDNAVEAEKVFRQAMAVAIRRSYRAIELHAGISLAKLLAENGRRAEARDLLAPIYAVFSEGFARPDLQAAKSLLAELT
jgi:predicted ATPase